MSALLASMIARVGACKPLTVLLVERHVTASDFCNAVNAGAKPTNGKRGSQLGPVMSITLVQNHWREYKWREKRLSHFRRCWMAWYLEASNFSNSLMMLGNVAWPARYVTTTSGQLSKISTARGPNGRLCPVKWNSISVVNNELRKEHTPGCYKCMKDYVLVIRSHDQVRKQVRKEGINWVLTYSYRQRPHAGSETITRYARIRGRKNKIPWMTALRCGYFFDFEVIIAY